MHLHPAVVEHLPAPPHGDCPGDVADNATHGQVHPIHVRARRHLHLLHRHHTQRQLPVDEQAEDAPSHAQGVPRATAAPALHAPAETQRRARPG